MEHLAEGGILIQLGAMAYLEIDVGGLDIGIGPDDGMIAHLDLAVRTIGRFVYGCQYVDGIARGVVVDVPLVVLDDKRIGYATHDGMLGCLDVHGAIGQRSDVILVDDASQEFAEPLPQGVAIEFAQQRCMMETYPAATSLLDVLHEVAGCTLVPGEGGIVELDDEVELVQGALAVEIVGRTHDLEGEVEFLALVDKPLDGCIAHGLVLSLSLGQHQYVGMSTMVVLAPQASGEAKDAEEKK